jgi:hypothetical protein
VKQKRRFRLELDIDTTLKVETVYESDYGANRYIKQLVNEFAKDPEALRGIILLKFNDYYCCREDFREKVDSFLENSCDEEAVILGVAQKCTPEVFQYFSDLLADDPGKEARPDNAAQKRETWKNQDSDWVFMELIQRLCSLVPVNAVFSELPRGEKKPPRN